MFQVGELVRTKCGTVAHVRQTLALSSNDRTPADSLKTPTQNASNVEAENVAIVSLELHLF